MPEHGDTIIFVTEVTPGTELGCDKCGHIACVCDILAKHKPECKYRQSATCPVPIECPHGYDVCPKCDPCTCNQPEEGVCDRD